MCVCEPQIENGVTYAAAHSEYKAPAISYGNLIKHTSIYSICDILVFY